MQDTVVERLNKLHLSLPHSKSPAASFVSAQIVDKLLFVSGTMPIGESGPLWKGTLGDNVSTAQGQEAARASTLLLLAHAKAVLGTLDRIRQCTRLEVFVRSTPDFEEQPKVANGASDLINLALGDKGRHTRFAIGVAALPFGVPVEVAATFAID